MTEYHVSFTLTDVCHRLQVSESLCVELVEYGIVSPVGPRPAEWTFDLEMLSSMQRAMRLHRDLELDWSGVALVTEFASSIVNTLVTSGTPPQYCDIL